MHDRNQRIGAHPQVLEEGVPQEQSLSDYYSTAVFNTPDLTPRLSGIMPILKRVDDLGGTLRERRILLSGLFWVAGEAEDLSNIGVSKEDFQRDIATFSDAHDPSQPAIEERFDLFDKAPYEKKRVLTEELLLAGWTGKRIGIWLNLSPSFVLDIKKELENKGLLERKEEKTEEKKGRFGKPATSQS